MWKMLTDKRGPLQGVSVETIVRNAYGSDAAYVEDTEGDAVGLIKRADDVLDSVIELHETDS
jgi:hypothetical protein